MNAPCPVCRAPYGFHDEAGHRAASARIPASLVRVSNSEIRRQRKAAA